MFGGRPDADPAGDVLHQRRVVQDQPLAQPLLAGGLVLAPELGDRRLDLGALLVGHPGVAAAPARRGGCDPTDCLTPGRRPVGSGQPTRAASGSGVRTVIARPQPLDAHMRVDLGRCERSVTEQLLNAAEVGTALEQVGGRAVPQAVRPEVGRARHGGQPPVDDRRGRSAGRPARRGRRAAAPARCGRSPTPVARAQPGVERRRGRHAVRHRALLGALAEHPHHPPRRGRRRRRRARTAPPTRMPVA